MAAADEVGLRAADPAMALDAAQAKRRGRSRHTEPRAAPRVAAPAGTPRELSDAYPAAESGCGKPRGRGALCRSRAQSRRGRDPRARSGETRLLLRFAAGPPALRAGPRSRGARFSRYARGNEPARDASGRAGLP